MEGIGVEVGQKMRMAIKAKLLELNCYVDDELPDYIMVMVANQRSKTQMTEDLNLFLLNKTPTFVNWLHLVLKKLKEVTVTNSEVYQNGAKRKSFGTLDLEVKKEKRTKRVNAEVEVWDECLEPSISKIKTENSQVFSSLEKISESKMSNEEINLNESAKGLSEQSSANSSQAFEHLENNSKEIGVGKRRNSPITFESNSDKKTTSILDRLGNETFGINKRNRIQFSEFRKIEQFSGSVFNRNVTKHEQECKNHNVSGKGFFIRHKHGSLNNGRNISNEVNNVVLNKSKVRLNENASVLRRLEVMSKIQVPSKENDIQYGEMLRKNVRSIVQVKPRVVSLDTPQPSKNLLLKAIAEAQKSILQAEKLKSNRSEELPKELKNSNENDSDKFKISDILLDSNKSTFGRMMFLNENSMDPGDEQTVYMPKPTYQSHEMEREEIKATREDEDETSVQTVSFHKSRSLENYSLGEKINEIKSTQNRLQRSCPSPITFEKLSAKAKTNRKIPDDLPTFRSTLSIKTKVRCKYWPTCRQGNKCVFVHPRTNCGNFPNCNYGDQCLYLHPICKFESSCTKRSCPYSHDNLRDIELISHGPKRESVFLQMCKFCPKCVGSNCSFHHPKLLKYEQYQKRFITRERFYSKCLSKPNLTWYSK